jgi:O-antigen ligase
VPKLVKNEIIAVAVSGFFLSLICGADTTKAFGYYVGVVVATSILLAGCFLPNRLLIYPVFFLMINMLDLTQAAPDEVEYGQILTASPWQFKLGPISPAALVFVSLLIICVRLFRPTRENLHISFFVYFFVVVTVVSAWFGFPQEDLSRFFSDAKIALFFGVGLLIFGSYYERYPDSVQITSQVFLALIAGHFSLDLVYLFLGVSTTMASGFANVSVDSGKGLLGLVIFWGLGNVLNKRQRIFSILICVTSFYLLVSYQTRWLIVSLALGLLIVVPVLLGTKRVLKVYVPVLLISLISVPVFIQVFPGVWEAMRLRFSFIEKISPTTSMGDVEAVRVASIYNSASLLIEQRAVFTGMGYGSWYSGAFVPMPRMTVSDFDLESLISGRYYRVHEFTFNFLFKFGLIGFYIYLATFIRPLRKMWKMRRQSLEDETSRAVMIFLMGSAPLVITNMWFTGKGLLVSALFVCVAHAWARAIKNSSVESETVPVDGRMDLPSLSFAPASIGN